MTNFTQAMLGGVVAGMLLMACFAALNHYLFQRYLVRKAERREAVMIEGAFYYIVPAIDYVHSSLNLPTRASVARFVGVEYQD